MNYRITKKFTQQNLIYLIILLSIGFVIGIKYYLFEECYGFDMNDDANHTFVNLYSAFQILSNFQIPQINLHNNFGTPILSDQLTLPFAIQSLTYIFFENSTAMLINRSLIGMITFYFIIKYFSNRFSIQTSLVIAILTFFSSGFFWNFAHHHYQLSLFFFTLILLLQDKFSIERKNFYFILLIFSYLFFYLSVNIQPFIISISFLILHPILIRKYKLFSINIQSIFLVLLITFPITYEFIKILDDIIRSEVSYTRYISDFRSLFLSIFFPANEWFFMSMNGHFKTANYYSFPVIIISLIGFLKMITFYKNKSNEKLLMFLVLGLIPSIAAVILQHVITIPYISTMDMTRVFWFSNFFLFFALAEFLDGILVYKKKEKIQYSIIFLIISLINIYLLKFDEIRSISFFYYIPSVIFLVISILIFFDIKKIIFPSLVFILILQIVPTLIHTQSLNLEGCPDARVNHYFNLKKYSKFYPQEILNKIEPGYRIASNELPINGSDMKAIYNNVFGSNARSINANKHLKNTLLENKLIRIDDSYFFTYPWNVKKLSDLGIRYILSNNIENSLLNNGWREISSFEKNSKKFYLYENNIKVSLVSLKNNNKKKFLHSYNIKGNNIEIDIQNTHYEYINFSFFNDGFWKGYINDKPIKILSDNYGMIKIPINKESKKIVIKYKSLNLNFYYIIVPFFVLYLVNYFRKKNGN